MASPSAVFAALGCECRPVLRALRRVRRRRDSAVTAWCGEAASGEVWVVQTCVALRHAVDTGLRTHLSGLAAERGMAVREGPMQCSAVLLATHREKQSAAAAGAPAVEMEGGAIAAAAAAAARRHRLR